MRLHEARKAVGLSKWKLEKLAGVERNTVYNIESGRVPDPRNSVVAKLVAALRKSGMSQLTADQLEFGDHEQVSR